MRKEFHRRTGRVRATPGRIVVLLGQAARGPAMDPILPQSQAEALRIFGSPEDSDLLRHFLFAQTAAPQVDYVLMRINGEHATASSPIRHHTLRVQAYEAGSHGNGIEVYAARGQLVIHSPNGRTRHYALDAATSVGTIIEQINIEAEDGQSPVVLSGLPLHNPATILLEMDPLVLSGGEDELPLTQNGLYQRLQEAYGYLEDFEMDVVIPLGAYFDTPHRPFTYGSFNYHEQTYSPGGDYLSLYDTQGNPARFHQQLLEFLSYRRARSHICHGILSCQPTKEAEGFFRTLAMEGTLTTREGFLRYADNQRMDQGGSMSILAQHAWDDQQGWLCLAPLYAAIWLQETISIINEPLPLDRYPIYPQLPSSTLQSLADIGVVGFGYSTRHQRSAVPYPVTATLADNDWHWADSMRAVQYVYRSFTDRIDPEIGSEMPWALRRHELQRSLQNLMDFWVDQGRLTDGSVSLDTHEPLMDLVFQPRATTKVLQARTSIGRSVR